MYREGSRCRGRHTPHKLHTLRVISGATTFCTGKASLLLQSVFGSCVCCFFCANSYFIFQTFNRFAVHLIWYVLVARTRFQFPRQSGGGGGQIIIIVLPPELFLFSPILFISASEAVVVGKRCSIVFQDISIPDHIQLNNNNRSLSPTPSANNKIAAHQQKLNTQYTTVNDSSGSH